MATAKKVPLPLPPVQPLFRITLELSKDEAEALLSVLGKVGGPTLSSRRKFIAPIYTALFDLKLDYVEAGAPDLSVRSGVLWFEERSDIHRD